MQYLSMHITDIVQNSLNAHATKIEIAIAINTPANILCLTITDNGLGMDQAFLKIATNPFTTTNITRNIGLGLSLLNQTSSLCNGFLNISSTVNISTKIHTQMQLNHINLPPMGNLAATIQSAIVANPNVEIIFTYLKDAYEFKLSTAEIKQILDDIPLTEPAVVKWLRETLTNGIVL